MPNKPFFFTDPSNLSTQTEAYGPVSGSETTQYRVTSKLQFSTASDAIAVCSGHVFIQENDSDDSLINLVLIPTESVSNGFTPVKYFVYRGLKKNNILDSSNDFLVQSNISASEFVKDIWTMFNAVKALDGSISTTKPNNKIIGWDKNANLGTDKLEAILSAKDNDFQLAPVAGGRTLSRFDITYGGVEIVLLDKLFTPTLEYVRAADFKITVSAPGGNDVPGNEQIAKMRQRENILNFVDPVAWYMLFYRIGVKYGASGNTAIGLDEIYNLLTTFQTKNTLYLDIRNENGYSLNYYKDNEGESSNSDYGNHLQISWDGNNFNLINFYSNFWPILPLSVTNNSSGFNQLSIKFRKQFNPQPLIYADYAHYFEKPTNPIEPLNSTFRFLEEPISSPMPTLWSNAIALTSPNRGVLPNSTQLAWIIRLTNLRLEYPTTPPPPSSAVPREKFLDNFFGSLAPLSELFESTSTSEWLTLPQKRFLYAEGLGGMYEMTMGKDSSNIYYCAQLVTAYHKISETVVSVEGLSTSGLGSGASQSDDVFSELNKELFGNNIEFQKQELTISSIQDHTLVVQQPIPKFDPSFVPKVISFTMTKTQFNDLLALSNPLLNQQLHEILLQFSGFEENQDDLGKIYYSTKVIQLVGLDSSGIYNSINTNLKAKGLSKIVLSTDASISNVLKLEQDRKTKISYSTLLDYLKYIDFVYKTSLNYDPTPNFTVTRLRAHSFGYPGRPVKLEQLWPPQEIATIGPLEALGFTTAVPNAPYLETKPGGLGACPVQGEPFRNRRQAILGTDQFCRIRMLYWGEIIGSFFFDYPTHVSLDIYDDLLEMELLEHQGVFIDVGHLLYGLDALLHPGSNGKPALFYQNVFNLQHALDFASFIGDIASALTAAYNEYGTNPSNANFDLQFTLKFPNSDVYGDIDAFGLKAAYDEVTTDSTKGFSDVFEHYYGASVPSNATTHYSKRFTRFALEWDLIDGQGNWKGNTSSYYSDIVQRTIKFAKFLYFTTGSVNPLLVFAELYIDSIDSYLLNVNDAPNYSVSHAEYLVDKFLGIVRTGFLNE